MHDRRLGDVLPQPIPSVSAVSSAPEKTRTVPAPNPPILVPSSTRASSAMIMTRVDTLPNIFGMFRRYYGEDLPLHDPERSVDLDSLSNIIPPGLAKDSAYSVSTTAGLGHGALNNSSIVYPYPNKASFLLGEWFWNEGAQKSHESFKNLLNIVGDSSFKPEDVQSTNWANINTQLAINDWDEGEWVDEDAGWQQSTVTVRIPFDSRTAVPGPKDYTVSDFYHRPIIPIIRERLQTNIDHFHFEPYELLWNCGNLTSGASPTFRLQGELYTSPAFLAAYEEVQTLQPEPNCELPRAVVGLMFWSDATHLTNFGSAKLWPLYMAFGNDSKYQRCKPSSNLFQHVAYFEQVWQRFFFIKHNISYYLCQFLSFHLHSRILLQSSRARRKFRRHFFRTAIVSSHMRSGA